MVRVLQVITDRDRRGAQVFALDLEHALRPQVDDIATVALAPGADGNLDVSVLGPTRIGLRTLRNLREVCRTVDIVVAHGSTTLPATALATAGLAKPFVYRQISDSLFWAPTALKRVRVRALLRRAARVVALWEGAARVLTEHFRVSAQAIRVIPNGVPASRYPLPDDQARARARRMLGLGHDTPVVVYVGTLVPEKRVDLAVDAVAHLPEAHLVVAGEGADRAHLEERANRLAPGRVHFMGRLEHPGRVYHAADVLVLPSRTESMPAVLIEAAMCGVPAIAPPVQAVSEIIEHGATGHLMPMDNPSALAAALKIYLEDTTFTRQAGHAARQRCLERFEIDRIAAMWLEVLDDVCSSGARAAERDLRTGGATG